MAESKAKIELTRECVIITDGGGTETRVGIKEHVSQDPALILDWVQMMKLQEISEYMNIIAKQNVEMIKVQIATAEYMKRISDVAANPPKMPDPMEMMEKAMEGFEKAMTSKSNLGDAFRTATSGVSMHPNGKD